MEPMRATTTIFLLLIGAFSLSWASTMGLNKRHDNSSSDPVAAVNHFRASYEERLYDFLFEDYNPRVRPCADVKCYDPLTVKFGASLLNAELHFSKKRMALHSWLSVTWTDPRLSWEPEDYGGVTELRVLQKGLWLPDIVLFTKDQIQGNLDKEWNGDVSAVLYSSGTVHVVPPSNLRVPCDFQEGASKQTCSLRFGSWTYSGFQMKLEMSDDGGCQLTHFNHVINEGWALESCDADIQSMYYPCCPEPYESMEFTVTFNKI